MALANYTDLSASILAWLDDPTKAAQIADFVALAEAEFNRTLRTPDMEGRATATLTGEVIAVPANFVGLKSIAANGAKFDILSADDLLSTEVYAGSPRYCAVIDEQFFFRPVPTSLEVSITYYQRIPTLVTAGTNWLLTKHPDLYLMASLMQAEFFGWNDERLPVIKSRAAEIMGQIMEAAQRERYGGRVIRSASGLSATTRQVRA